VKCGIGDLFAEQGYSPELLICMSGLPMPSQAVVTDTTSQLVLSAVARAGKQNNKNNNKNGDAIWVFKNKIY
jgi:hypothetical protein